MKPPLDWVVGVAIGLLVGSGLSLVACSTRPTIARTVHLGSYSHVRLCRLGDENWVQYYPKYGVELRCDNGQITIGASVP